jgi:predicted Zn-ribbon and HTH transcriptional regulator
MPDPAWGPPPAGWQLWVPDAAPAGAPLHGAPGAGPTPATGVQFRGVYQQGCPAWMREGTVKATLLMGDEDLEVVGESYRQDNLWRVVGGRHRPEARVREGVHAMLLAEDGNPYDPNAVSVWINGLMVGYLPRDQARVLRPGLLAAQERKGTPIALEGVIAGGGMRRDGPGQLGVFLRYDPEELGLSAPSRRGWRTSSAPENAPVAQVSLLGGQDDLEVVGELAYQSALWRLCGGTVGDRVRHDIVAVLVPEPANPYDPNAIAVQIEGHVVGYLPRATAQEYVPGLRQLMASRGGYVALRGVILGGGYYDDGPGRLGVWLEHDPADFDVHLASSSRSGPPGHSSADGVMRTGFTEAWLTDAEDDSYDLSWFNDLPEADRPAIAKLRELLAADPDPIDRHFQFAELESRLYHSRDLYESALDEYDETCARHDAEMESICAAFMAKWGKIPLLDTYRQMAIRQQKRKDWPACKWWSERGLALYGQEAAREEAVEDLIKRRNRAVEKLEAAATQARPARPESTHRAVVTRTPPAGRDEATGPDAELEVLACQKCGSRFERMRVRGRKPTLCPRCRTAAKP